MSCRCLRSLLTSDFVLPFHPLKSYLDLLTEWDRTTDFIAELAGMVHCKCCDSPVYGHHKLRLPHIASLCATGNKKEFLTDDSGNRRWLPFEIESIDNPFTTPIDYAGVYAHALALLESGYRYYFDTMEVDKLNHRNRAFEEENDARNLVLTYYRRPAEGENYKLMNTTQIILRFGGALRLNRSQLSTALRQLGFTQTRSNNCRMWQVVERTAEEMNNVMPEPIIETIPGTVAETETAVPFTEADADARTNAVLPFAEKDADVENGAGVLFPDVDADL